MNVDGIRDLSTDELDFVVGAGVVGQGSITGPVTKFVDSEVTDVDALGISELGALSDSI